MARLGFPLKTTKIKKALKYSQKNTEYMAAHLFLRMAKQMRTNDSYIFFSRNVGTSEINHGVALNPAVLCVWGGNATDLLMPHARISQKAYSTSESRVLVLPFSEGLILHQKDPFGVSFHFIK